MRGLQVGRKAWLSSHGITMPWDRHRPSKKLKAKFYGPFKILEQTSPVTFKLELPRAVNIHPIFHVGLLKPHFEIAKGYKAEPLPTADDDGEYEIEKILGHRRKRNGDCTYLVKWKGYSYEESTWEPRSNFKSHTLKAYHDRRKEQREQVTDSSSDDDVDEEPPIKTRRAARKGRGAGRAETATLNSAALSTQTSEHSGYVHESTAAQAEVHVMDTRPCDQSEEWLYALAAESKDKASTTTPITLGKAAVSTDFNEAVAAWGAEMLMNFSTDPDSRHAKPCSPVESSKGNTHNQLKEDEPQGHSHHQRCGVIAWQTDPTTATRSCSKEELQKDTLLGSPMSPKEHRRTSGVTTNDYLAQGCLWSKDITHTMEQGSSDASY